MKGKGSRHHRIRLGWIFTAALVLALAGAAGYFTYQVQRTRNTERLLREARTFEQSGDLERAIESYGHYLERNGQDVAAMRAYSSLLYSRLETSRKWLGPTLNALRRLNRLDPQDTQTMERLVRLYMELQQFGLAEELARSWMQSSPKDAEAVVAVARATNANNKSDDALRVLIDANGRDPGEARYYPPIIDLQDNVFRRDKDARDWIDRALNNAPQSYPVELAAFAYFQHHGQLDQAQQHIERALELAPDNPEVLLPAAQFFTAQYEVARAGGLLERAAKYHPNQIQYLAARRVHAVASRDDALLVAAAHEMEEAYSAENPVLLAQAAELYLRATAMSQADACIGKLEHENERMLPKGTLDVLRGARDLLGDRPYAALVALESAVRQQPSDLWTLELLARAYLRTGAADEAADLYRRLTLLAPSMSSPRLALARLELEAGHIDRAREALDSLASVGGPQERQVQWLTLLADVNESDEATRENRMQVAEALAATPPADLAELEIRASVFIAGGKPARAMETWQNWQQRSMTFRRIGLDSARRLVANGQLAAANQWADLLEKDKPNSVESALVRCDILWALQKGDEAEELVRTFGGSPDDEGLLWELLAEKSPAEATRLSAFSKAAQLRPREIVVRQKWVRLVQDLPTAQKIIEEIRTLEGDQGTQWKFELASIHLRIGDSASSFSSASDLLRQCLDVRPGWAAARALLGYAAERLNDLPRAVESYRAALALDADLATRPVAMRLVDVLKRLGRFQEADAILMPLARAMPNSVDVMQLLVDQAVRHNELSSAAALAEQVLQKQSENSSWAALTADLLLRAGKPERAEQVAREALAKNPKAPGAVASLSQSLMFQNRSDEALVLARTYAEKETNPSFTILLVGLLRQTGNPEEARQVMERALTREPNNITLCSFASDFWAREGDRVRQLALARKTLQLRGDDPAQSLWLASLLVSGDSVQREEAQSIIRHRHEAQGDDAEALILRAQLALTGNPPDTNQAQADLRAALKMNPRSMPARKMLAALLIQTAELDESYETVAGGLLDSPEDRDLLLLAAQIRQLQGDFSGSMPALRKLYSLPEPPPLASELLAVAARETHQIPAAISILEGVPNRRQQEVIALARLYEAANDAEKSIALLNGVIKTSPEAGAAALLQFFARQGDFARIEEFASAHAVEYPQDITSQLLAAELLASDASNPDARQRGMDGLTRIAAAHPALVPDARFRAGLAYLKHGDLVNAETMLLSATQLAPQAPKPINALAWLYGEESANPQRGLEVIRKYETSGGPLTAELLDTYGLLLFRVGRFDEAIAKLSECLRVAGHSTDRTAATFHLALAQQAKGAHSDAASNFRGALKLHAKIGGLTSGQLEQCRSSIGSNVMDR